MMTSQKISSNSLIRNLELIAYDLVKIVLSLVYQSLLVNAIAQAKPQFRSCDYLVFL